MLIEDLRDRIDAGPQPRILFSDGALPVQSLWAVDRERARVDDAADVEQAGRLEAVVHAQNVDSHLRMRVALGSAEDVGQIEHALRFRRDQRLDDIVHHGDVAVEDLDLVAQRIEHRRVGIDVHAVNFVSVLDQPTHHARTNEAAPAQHCYTHLDPPSVVCPPYVGAR